MTWPASVPSWTPGMVVTSADLNLIRDALNALGSAWTPYTPTLTGATTDPTMGTSVVSGRYRLVGNTLDVHMDLTIGSGFAPGAGSWLFSLPSTGKSPVDTAPTGWVGHSTVRDASPTAAYAFVVVYSSPTKVALFSSVNGNIMGAGSPITWAVGDTVSLHLPALEVA